MADLKDSTVSIATVDAGIPDEVKKAIPNTESRREELCQDDSAASAPPVDIVMRNDDSELSEDSTSFSGSDQASATTSEISLGEWEKQATKSAQDPPMRDLSSVDDLPKLEQLIPEDFLPDMLLVHDPASITSGANGGPCSEEPKKYKRLFPKLARDAADWINPQSARVAHLHLKKSNRLGTGNHSYVYRAPLTLPKPLSGRSPTGQVTVAAKTSFPALGDRRLLRNEAKIYNAFPKHLMQEYCGYNLVTPMMHPVPVGAVVPKFYGYYVPVDDSGKSLDEIDKHAQRRDSYETEWLSPILLLEECGDPVQPEKFTIDERYVFRIQCESG